MLRWALELAITREPQASRVGWAMLEALARADLLQPTEQVFLDAVTQLRLSARIAGVRGTESSADDTEEA